MSLDCHGRKLTRPRKGQGASARCYSVFSAAVFLAIALVAIKATYVGISSFWDWVSSPGDYVSFLYLSWAATASRSDLLFAIVTGAIGVFLCGLASSHPRVSRFVFFGFVLFGIVCLIYAIVGRQAFAYFGSQLTLQLLFLSGDISQLRDSITPYLTPPVLFALVGVTLLYAGVTWTMHKVSRCWSVRCWNTVVAASFAGVLLWLGLGTRLAGSNWFESQDQYIVENPHWTMLESAFLELRGARDAALSIDFPRDDLNDFLNKCNAEESINHPGINIHELRNQPIKNLIVIVLESVGSRYLSIYDTGSVATPLMASEADNALIFDNYYTPVGWTAHALTAILHSVHVPVKRYNTTSFSLDRIPGPSIGAVLRQRGYRTAFLSAGDPHWASTGILDTSAFDVIKIGSQLAPGDTNSSWGVSDEHLFQAIQDFTDDQSERPFFLFAWTDQTHHPYKLGDKKLDDEKSPFERYLAILTGVDRYIGQLFNHLRETGLADDTLVVVTGDHGEAFGKTHANNGHGFSVYDEELRVPLMLWNPRIFSGNTRESTIGSHVSLAPTLLHLLGESPPCEWHGYSLFSDDHPGRAYLFAAAWGQYLLGVRDDEWKYIIDARRGTEELYRLADDPLEQTNVASTHPERALRLRRRLAAMLKFNEANYSWMK
jgi:arylsulfatase A-like enzyme